jgi:hypothetical protein
MTGITAAHVVENGGPNVAELLSFFDSVAALTSEQAVRLGQAFDDLDEDRWQQAAEAGVQIARTANPTCRTAWYRARHAAHHVAHERGFTDHSFGYHEAPGRAPAPAQVAGGRMHVSTMNAVRPRSRHGTWDRPSVAGCWFSGYQAVCHHSLALPAQVDMTTAAPFHWFEASMDRHLLL